MLAACWLVLAGSACSVPPERSIIDAFFTAARLRDTTALHALATTTFEPLDRGIVVEFEIEAVSVLDERRKAITIHAPVHRPDGQVVNERLAVTLERGLLNASADDSRRWIVTSVEARP